MGRGYGEPVTQAGRCAHISPKGPQLDSACARLKLAVDAKNAADEFASADHVHHVIATLRELFCCRDVGDGFGAVTNAALAGLENLGGGVTTIRQLTALLRRLERIQREPFISMADASSEIDLLEAADLDVQPIGFAVVEEWLLDD